jgi:hypothetical protein
MASERRIVRWFGGIVLAGLAGLTGCSSSRSGSSAAAVAQEDIRMTADIGDDGVGMICFFIRGASDAEQSPPGCFDIDLRPGQGAGQNWDSGFLAGGIASGSGRAFVWWVGQFRLETDGDATTQYLGRYGRFAATYRSLELPGDQAFACFRFAREGVVVFRRSDDPPTVEVLIDAYGEQVSDHRVDDICPNLAPPRPPGTLTPRPLETAPG